MIRVKNLSKTYGEHQALKNVSFEVPRGQVVGFLGPNGAGKTTTMRIIVGYLSATSGHSLVNGIDVQVDPVRARKSIGYLSENNPLYDEMMVIDYLQFISEVRAIETVSRNKLIALAVERCGIGDVVGKDIGTLSKGYRQRVGLTQAILHDPDLLILDEPTSGLDPNQIVEIRALIKELGREKTIVMSTHILSEVQSTCSRVLIVHEGELVADDAPDQLAKGEGGNLSIEVAPKNGTPVDEAEITRAFNSVPGIRGVERKPSPGKSLNFSINYGFDDPRRQIFEKIIALDLVLLEMHKKEVTLEETFRKLTIEEASL